MMMLNSLLLFLLPALAAPQAALIGALRGTGAIGLVMQVSTGQRLATVGNPAVRSAPGSILKPLFLAAALQQGELLPGTSVFCRRNLTISDGAQHWNLPCTHPQTQHAFSAREAIAYSCNRYFAELADRIPPAQAVTVLRQYGLAPPITPLSREDKELLVLGVAHIQVSPLEMAIAYRRLAMQLNAVPAVRDGLKDSVTYGMAHHAAVPSMEILGKTGTAGNRAGSHGWFVGIAPMNAEQVILVIYQPRGNGADAAGLARHFFLASAHQP